MDASKSASTSLFQVYLRLRPASSPTLPQIQESFCPQPASAERFLTVELPSGSTEDCLPTHITLHPPSDRKRAVEKFAFTKVFEEHTSQLDIFRGTGVAPLIEGVVGERRDGLIATLGVTGSGKSHTILGSKSQRGLTQLSLDIIFRSLNGNILSAVDTPSLISSLIAANTSEAQILPAATFLDSIYGDPSQDRGNSRATTPMVGEEQSYISRQKEKGGLFNQWAILGLNSSTSSSALPSLPENRSSIANAKAEKTKHPNTPSRFLFWNTARATRSEAKLRSGTTLQETGQTSNTPRRHLPQRPIITAQPPDVSIYTASPTPNTDYAILISMYEVHNDRIFDLLSQVHNPKDRRRALLFKPTEGSPDRKVVAGLRKIVCSSYEEAIMVLETGLTERQVAKTNSNSVSSRSHGFFCVEVKKRARGGMSSAWSGAQLTVVDLAGSERARNAKTAGATLAEAGKINESLMYLGQCLQMQSDCNEGNKSLIVPFRQCKLTELLFSNSFPSHAQQSAQSHHHRNPQKAVMIVTADPVGDFNATSQILRYSALAREVTVPRMPSVASTIFSVNSGSQDAHSRPNTREGDRSGHLYSHADVEALTLQVVRLEDEVEVLGVRLAEEEARRREAEEGWSKAEEIAEEREREAVEECWESMEKKFEEERRRWMDRMAEEAERNEEHLNRKLDILSHGIQSGIRIHEDQPDVTNERILELEDENAVLQRRIAALERELQCRSPTKKQKKVIPPRDSGSSMLSDENITLKLKDLDLNAAAAVPLPKTPGRKIRKLTPKTAYSEERTCGLLFADSP